jgi:hypothetical protein
LSERLGELNAKKDFVRAGYQSAGDLKRIAANQGKVTQGIDQGYRNMKPFRGKQVVVEAKGYAKTPARANQAGLLQTDTRGMVEGAANWNMDRLRTAANSGNKNAQRMLKELGSQSPESFLSVTNARTGQTTVSRLQGATGRPTATVLTGLENVSPVAEMITAKAVDATARAAVGQ